MSTGALPAQAAALHAGQLAERGVEVGQAPREPKRGRLGDVHPHVKSQQLPLAQQAWRGAAQSAVAELAVHTDVCAQFAPDPIDNLVRLDTMHPCLPYPQI